MRRWTAVPLAALASCGGEAEQKAKAPPPAQAFEAGQWQSQLEVTNFRRADPGRPRLDMPIGTRTSGAACVAAADVSRPPPELFPGTDFENCRWGPDFYMRNGRLISSMICRRDGVGPVDVTVNVDFTADGYRGTVEMVTRLPTDGDIVLAARAEGRRTGACTGDAEAANQTQTR